MEYFYSIFVAWRIHFYPTIVAAKTPHPQLLILAECIPDVSIKSGWYDKVYFDNTTWQCIGWAKTWKFIWEKRSHGSEVCEKSLGNYNFSKLFTLREAKHGMKARMSEKYFVTPSRTKHHKDSAVPYLQNLLNNDHLEKRQTLKKLFSCKSSQSYASIEQKKRVNYISNVDVIT